MTKTVALLSLLTFLAWEAYLLTGRGFVLELITGIFVGATFGISATSACLDLRSSRRWDR